MSEKLRAAIGSAAAIGAIDEDDRAELMAAMASHDELQAVRAQVAAFDWTSLLKLVGPLLSLIPGIGPVLTIINAILALLKVAPIVVPPAPNGGGGTIPTPVP